MHLGESGEAERCFSVLIVDSDPKFGRDSCELVATQGHPAWGAQDLIAAVSFLHDQTPQLLLVELALLEMDGADPLGDLRAHAPGVPIVIMDDGPPDERFEAFSRAHNVFGYLNKRHGDEGLRLWLDSAQRLTRPRPTS